MRGGGGGGAAGEWRGGLKPLDKGGMVREDRGGGGNTVGRKKKSGCPSPPLTHHGGPSIPHTTVSILYYSIYGHHLTQHGGHCPSKISETSNGYRKISRNDNLLRGVSWGQPDCALKKTTKGASKTKDSSSEAQQGSIPEPLRRRVAHAQGHSLAHAQQLLVACKSQHGRNALLGAQCMAVRVLDTPGALQLHCQWEWAPSCR